jgi:hypothetical protein
MTESDNYVIQDYQAQELTHARLIALSVDVGTESKAFRRLARYTTTMREIAVNDQL